MESIQKQNIFVVHTTFQIYVSEIMVGTLGEFVNCKNVLLLEFKQRFEHINLKMWSEVLYIENVGNSTLGHDRYVMCENNVGLVRNLIVKNPKTKLFLSDISWPMNNRLFFDKHIKRKVTFCLISDGVGTYLLPKITRILFARGMVKQLNGLLRGGVRYRNYLGSQFGVDRKKIKYIYAPNAALIDCDLAKKKEILTTSLNRPYFDQSKCIFLESNGWFFVNEKEWSLIRTKTVSFLKSLGAEIYYKNHHFGRKEEESYYYNQGFNIIESDRCAEQIIAEEGFGIAVSYMSSTLFNLKSLYEDSIRCIALSEKTLSSNQDYNENKFVELYELYRKVNAEVVDI
jgi:hypothetical protein